jgi:drug/metabolite transporter (DMT)-like permease
MTIIPYLSVLAAAALGAFSGVIIKLVDMPSTSIAFFRLFVPVVLLCLYFSHKKIRPFRSDKKQMLILSIANAIRLFLYIVSFAYTSLFNAVVIFFTWPIFAALFSMIFLKEKVTRKSLALILLAFIGMVFLKSNGAVSLESSDFIGITAALTSSIMNAAITVFFKKYTATRHKTELIFFQNLIGALIFLPFIFLNPLPTVTDVSLGISYGAFIGIGAFLLFFYGLKHLKVSHYSLFCYFEVPAAVIFGIIFFQEMLTLNMVIGAILITTSGILLRNSKSHVKNS